MVDTIQASVKPCPHCPNPFVVLSWTQSLRNRHLDAGAWYILVPCPKCERPVSFALRELMAK